VLPASLVCYTYVLNNPILYIDPFGMLYVTVNGKSVGSLAQGNVVYIDAIDAFEALGFTMVKSGSVYTSRWRLYDFTARGTMHVHTAYYASLTLQAYRNEISPAYFSLTGTKTVDVVHERGGTVYPFVFPFDYENRSLLLGNNGYTFMSVEYFELLVCKTTTKCPNVGIYKGNYRAFLDVLAMRESSNRYDAVRSNAYFGRYQMGWLALDDAGFADSKNKTWTALANSYGVRSIQDFLNTPHAQETAIVNYHKKTYLYLRSYGALPYLGQTMNGIKITESGLLAAAHLIGFGDLIAALQKGDLLYKSDELGTTAFEYAELLGGYDISDVK